MERVRTTKPFLVGLTLLEEMETDICVDEEDERTLKVYDELSSEQPTSITLKRIMESEIRSGTREENPNEENTNEERNEDDKNNNTECQCIKESPCVWASNSNGMVEWDENEHGHLVGNELPSNSTRRKYLYRQMALTLLEQPLGKGNRIVLPDCIKNGIRTLLLEEEGQYMGHKDE
jgi:hypothetical protein